jgi:hypothetical protein
MFLNLYVFDAKTHFVLWTVKAPLRSRLEQSVNTAVAQLVNSLKSLLAAGGPIAAK